MYETANFYPVKENILYRFFMMRKLYISKMMYLYNK